MRPWRPEVNVSIIPQMLSILFVKHDLSFDLKFTEEARLVQEAPCLHLLSAEIIGHFRSLGLEGEHCVH